MADGGRSHSDFGRSLSPVAPPSSAKRKFDDPGRPTGFSDAPKSYKTVPPPLSDFELAKQKAEQIAARLVGHELKRSRTSIDDTDSSLGNNVDRGHSHNFDLYQNTQSRKMDVPNTKVGLVIGKGGETIRNLQLQSGARIQVARDGEIEPGSTTRQVELTGSAEQIARAEQLIREVIGDIGGGGGGVPTAGEQIQIRVPNNKVGLIIGKGGETIRNLQSNSGARIQVQHDRETEQGATERLVTLTGTKQQTDLATEMIKDVIGEGRGKAYGGYQQGYGGYQQGAYGYQQEYSGQQYGAGGYWDGSQGSYDYYQQNQGDGTQQSNDGTYNYQQGYYGYEQGYEQQAGYDQQYAGYEGYDQQAAAAAGYDYSQAGYDQASYDQQAAAAAGYDYNQGQQAYSQQEQDYAASGYQQQAYPGYEQPPKPPGVASAPAAAAAAAPPGAADAADASAPAAAAAAASPNKTDGEPPAAADKS